MNDIYNEIQQTFDNAYDNAENSDASMWQDVAPQEPRRLNTISGADLCDMRLPHSAYTVDTLLRPGLAILAGAPKIGKSWMVLYLCLQVAKGEPVWGMKTTQGSVLYIALEDSWQRLQDRILAITDNCSEAIHFSLNCAPLGDALEEEIRTFTADYPDARLVVIDTFQKIRAQAAEMSYANDYSEVSRLKNIADELNLCILLVHHTRKQSDNDCMNEISGTNGIAGSADTLMVLKKEKRTARTATLSCTGRDIEDREMTLTLNSEQCIWQLKQDSLQPKTQQTPREILLLVAYMQTVGYSFSSMSDFTGDYCRRTGVRIEPNQLKRLMNLYRFDLEEQGVSFASVRRPQARMLSITYCEPKPAGDGAEDQAGSTGNASDNSRRQPADDDAAPSYDGDLPFD